MRLLQPEHADMGEDTCLSKPWYCVACDEWHEDHVISFPVGAETLPSGERYIALNCRLVPWHACVSAVGCIGRVDRWEPGECDGWCHAPAWVCSLCGGTVEYEDSFNECHIKKCPKLTCCYHNEQYSTSRNR